MSSKAKLSMQLHLKSNGETRPFLPSDGIGTVHPLYNTSGFLRPRTQLLQQKKVPQPFSDNIRIEIDSFSCTRKCNYILRFCHNEIGIEYTQIIVMGKRVKNNKSTRNNNFYNLVSRVRACANDHDLVARHPKLCDIRGPMSSRWRALILNAILTKTRTNVVHPTDGLMVDGGGAYTYSSTRDAHHRTGVGLISGDARARASLLNHHSLYRIEEDTDR